MAGLAAIPLVFGFAALIVAPDPPAKLLGALVFFFAAGAIAPLFFPGAVQAEPEPPPTRAGFRVPTHPHANPEDMKRAKARSFAEFWGSVCGVAAAVLLLYQQYTVGDHTPWMWWWWALLLVSIISLIHATRSPPELGSRALWAGVAAVVTSTTVVGLTQYWYRTYYEPLRVVPVLDVSAKLKTVTASSRGVDPLDVVVTVKNPTSVAIQPLASLFTVTGFRPSRVSLSAVRFRGLIRGVVSGTPEASYVDRYAGFHRSLVAAGPLLPLDEVIPAKGTRVIHLVVELPSHNPRFVDAALKVEIAFVQSERLVLVPKQISKACAFSSGLLVHSAKGICSDLARARRGTGWTAAVVSEWSIPRKTLLAWAITDKRYILAAVVQGRTAIGYPHSIPPGHFGARPTVLGPDTPYVYATANAKGKNAGRADPGRLGKYYFVSLVSATEITQIPTPAKAEGAGTGTSRG
jgi:hypothetical protein